MSEFSSSVTLDVEVDARSLANARDEIEDELGGVESAVAADTGGGGGRGGQRRRRRLEFRWRKENNENIAAILDELQTSGDDLGGGGDSDGRVKRLLRTGGGLLAGGIGLGVGALSTTLSGFTWPDLPSLKQPNWLPPEVPEPGWTPVGVEDPEQAPVEDPSEVTIEDGQTVTLADGETVGVNEGETVGLAEGQTVTLADGETVEVEEPDFKVQVEESPSAEGTDRSAAKKGLIGGGLLAAGAGAAYTIRQGALSGLRGGVSSAAAGVSGLGIPAPGFLLADRASEAQRKDEDERGFIDRKLAGLLGGAGRAVGGRQVAALGAGAGDRSIEPFARAGASLITDRASELGQPNAGAGDVSVTVERGDTIIDADVESAVTDLQRELERELDSTIRDVEQRVQDLETQLDRATGGSGSIGGRTGP